MYTYQCLPPNDDPVLSEPTLTPAEGETGDLFTWTVIYTDAEEDAPTTAAVTLYNPVTGAWENRAMSATDTTYADGALFTLTLALADTGTYLYRYNFMNEHDQTVHLPGPPLNQYEGPVVTPEINDPPVLTDPACSPDPGPAGGSFAFAVRYTDPEGEQPSITARVSVWSPVTGTATDHGMTTDDPDCTDGSLYGCELVLPDAGAYRHRFTFVNEAYQFVTLPAEPGAWLEGPVVAGTSGVPGAGPSATAALPPAPNPANPGVRLRWRLAAPGRVTWELYDARGCLVRRLEAGERPAGEGEILWFGDDDRGRAAPSGVYLARLSATVAGRRVRSVTKLNLVR
jgi:hypothetical protein